MKNITFLMLFLISFLGCNFETEVQPALPTAPAPAKESSLPLGELPVDIKNPPEAQKQKVSAGDMAKVAVPVGGAAVVLGLVYGFWGNIKRRFNTKSSDSGGIKTTLAIIHHQTDNTTTQTQTTPPVSVPEVNKPIVKTWSEQHKEAVERKNFEEAKTLLNSQDQSVLPYFFEGQTPAIYSVLKQAAVEDIGYFEALLDFVSKHKQTLNIFKMGLKMQQKAYTTKTNETVQVYPFIYFDSPLGMVLQSHCPLVTPKLIEKFISVLPTDQREAYLLISEFGAYQGAWKWEYVFKDAVNDKRYNCTDELKEWANQYFLNKGKVYITAF